jgi:hypothetical protein
VSETSSDESVKFEDEVPEVLATVLHRESVKFEDLPEVLAIVLHRDSSAFDIIRSGRGMSGASSSISESSATTEPS